MVKEEEEKGELLRPLFALSIHRSYFKYNCPPLFLDLTLPVLSLGNESSWKAGSDTKIPKP